MDREKPDLVSGSVDLLEHAAGRIKVHLDRRGTAELAELLEAIVREHPSMALRINLAGAVRAAMVQGREAAAEALEGFLTGLMRSRLLAAGSFAALVHENRWTRVATYSRSGQVRECLASARQAGLCEVLLSEGRPAGEGVLMAGELRGEGFVVTLTADAALPSLLPAAQVLVVGTDAAFDTGFVNKVGTAALLREAKAAGVPSVVLTVPEKRLDAATAPGWTNLPLARPPRLGKMPRGATWAGDLFEFVSWELATHRIGKGTPA
jgi:translation initiation factor eIF-2B subunit delta